MVNVHSYVAANYLQGYKAADQRPRRPWGRSHVKRRDQACRTRAPSGVGGSGVHGGMGAACAVWIGIIQVTVPGPCDGRA